MAAPSASRFGQLPRLRTVAPAPAGMPRGYPGEPDGMDVLREAASAAGLAGDDSLALSLWLAVRRVFTWASVEPGRREGLFSQATPAAAERLDRAVAQAPDLAEPLHRFAALVENPHAAEASQVADACDRVAKWASGQGFLRTAVLFAEAAATAEPNSAVRAMNAGMMCQRAGGSELSRRAEQWHQRAFGVARKSERSSRLLSIRAMLAYGNWARDSGRYTLAQKCYLHASRRARRYGRWKYFAMANHNLLLLLLSTGADFDVGETYARAALAHYPEGDPRVCYLAHDYAALLIRNGRYWCANRLLTLLIPRLRLPREQILLQSSLAWAAAGVGERASYERAAREVLSQVDHVSEFASNALVQLAEGAFLLGEDDRVIDYVGRAEVTARRSSDQDVLRAVQDLLARIAAECPSTARRVHEACGKGSLTELFAAVINPQAKDLVSGNVSQGWRPVTLSSSHARIIPPPPSWSLWGGVETLDGLSVLEEADRVARLPPGRSLALELWTALRRVRRWVDSYADSEIRPDETVLADTDAREGTLAQVPRLSAAMKVLSSTQNARPSGWESRLADACDQVSRWATDHLLMRTAVLFAEAAARSEPEDAVRAMDAALACQRISGRVMMNRAEQWLERAFLLARGAKNGRRLLAIRSLLAYGNWAREAGRILLARSCYEKAARRAKRHCRWSYYASANHNLLVLCLSPGGDTTEGEVFAKRALENYS